MFCLELLRGFGCVFVMLAEGRIEWFEVILVDYVLIPRFYVSAWFSCDE